MLVRLISDLHLDINSRYDVEIPNNHVYTLIAGDLGGDYRQNAEWIRKNVRVGAFISGNHDAYTHDKTPVDDVKEFYHENFPSDSEITYFDYDVGVISKPIDDKTLLVADVLYTDYKYCIDESQKRMKVKDRIERNMFHASPRFSGTYMNDFNFFTRKGTYRKNPEFSLYDHCPTDLFYLRPKNYKNHFDKAFRSITRVIEENTDKNIILMTHHCLSKDCVSESFHHSTLNASYVSDKDSWIRKHPNIRLVFSGHMHHRTIFSIGNGTKYVLNPLGYLPYGQNIQFDYEKNEKTFWTPDLFIDTETWEITSNGYNNPQWRKQQDKDMALAMAFM